ncbi:probable ubiquitin-conjugating enzyme E2 26 isoform X1 [Vigna umbellata]|uniref:probable ubiquitin-conjugating enzyme E2 26 isoform X1 n=1 Tax=Vigna umbellata TaxID=87088 RepID=UPI001F5E853D|nr:probable ubiquitin-conjugating enzyme E2 26 isoform X1 [Vigna umbellata]
MDPGFVEIPPPVTSNTPNSMKPEEAIRHDVIDIDDDNDSTELVLVGDKVGKIDKGKAIATVHDDYGDHQNMELLDDDVMDKSGSGDGHNADSSCDDDDYSDLFSDDYIDADQSALIQNHFDNVDIPPGIEVPIPWMADLGLKKTNNHSLSPWSHTMSGAYVSQVTDSSQHLLTLEPSNLETQGPSAGNSNLQVKMNTIIQHPSGVELSSPLVNCLNKKKSNASKHRRHKPKLAFGMKSSKSNLFTGPSESKKKANIFYAPASNIFVDNFEAKKLPNASEVPHWGHFGNSTTADGSKTLNHSNFVGSSFHFPGAGFNNDMWSKKDLHFQPLSSYTVKSSFVGPFVPFSAAPEPLFDNSRVHYPVGDGNNGAAAESAVATISDEARDEILRKFQNFKQFDTIENTSDHYFLNASCSMKQVSQKCAKRLQEEWKSLEKDLPDSIFVRVYESRIDLLRAVIIGAEGTPYHDGLFFFDFFFPSSYPTIPPDVHYHSCGLRLNPNLYSSGKVCLSLLNTWSGHENEKWQPGVSTILQVLVSIQGLILNSEPYYNEPGFAHLMGSKEGAFNSLHYNENTFILSLRTMEYIMRRPPKNFEDFVAGQFCSRAHDILVACKAYIDGAQVGCLTKGGVQDVDQGDKSCSNQFRTSLSAHVDVLVREFTKIGAKDCDKVFPSAKEKTPLDEMPEVAAVPDKNFET